MKAPFFLRRAYAHVFGKYGLDKERYLDEHLRIGDALHLTGFVRDLNDQLVVRGQEALIYAIGDSVTKNPRKDTYQRLELRVVTPDLFSVEHQTVPLLSLAVQDALHQLQMPMQVQQRTSFMAQGGIDSRLQLVGDTGVWTKLDNQREVFLLLGNRYRPETAVLALAHERDRRPRSERGFCILYEPSHFKRNNYHQVTSANHD